MQQAVQIEAGHVEPLCHTAVQRWIAVYVGCIERSADRGGHILAREGGDSQPAPRHSALIFEPDPRALWVLCVMTARPNTGATEATVGGRYFLDTRRAGARRGIGGQERGMTAKEAWTWRLMAYKV